MNITEINEFQIDWNLFNTPEIDGNPISLFRQLQVGCRENWLNLNENKYLDTIVEALKCHISIHNPIEEFQVYCGVNLFAILVRNGLSKGLKFTNLAEPNNELIEINGIKLKFQEKIEIPENYLCCFSINGQPNIQLLELDTKKAFKLIDRCNSLIIHFLNH
jgi:hypothetical protein